MAATATDALDTAHLRAALNLAARGLGRVWPNPAVGCVLTDAAGHVVGRGFTQPGGRPHAETEALRQAGAAARGGTAYVTLEPCAHHGQTPPCAVALVAAGISRCVVALEDPDPRVAGRGVALLRAAGIAVDCGRLAAAARELNEGFLLRVMAGRPLLALKLASSLDGRIATRSGESRWITDEAARARGHLLRASHDAILVGSGTALADNPALTCRLPGLTARSPVRIVVDSRLRTRFDGNLADRSGRPTWLVTGPRHDPARLKPYWDAGFEVLEVGLGADGRLDLAEAAAALGQRGLTRVLVEGGATVAAALLRADLVDRLHWFRAPGLIGGDGLAAIGEMGLDRLELMPRFTPVDGAEGQGTAPETYRRISQKLLE